ncbi:MAG: hypothetical protein FWD33_01365 [Alphaproteobacteria bacterium]|nr:hypothetical protein [Alphaproteobacteria bacterium]
MKILYIKFLSAGLIAIAVSASASTPAPTGRAARGIPATTTAPAEGAAPTVSTAGRGVVTRGAAPGIAPTGIIAAQVVQANAPEVIAEEPPTATTNADRIKTRMQDMSGGRRSGGTNAWERALGAQSDRERREATLIQFRRRINPTDRTPCATELLACVKQDCGDNLQRCFNDGDGVWSERFNRCRTRVNCSGAELSVYGKIIRDDVEVDARLWLFGQIINGNEAYSRCLQTQCATQRAAGTLLGHVAIGFNGCVTQARINQALSACRPVYDEFRQFDSNLQVRFTNMMGALRVEREKQIHALQAELDAMMPAMRNMCTSVGAVFDDRNGECAFTAIFSVEADGRRYTPASRKIAPGGDFVCTEEWFGVDVTRYLMNAINRDVTAAGASAAFLGAGLGVGAASLVTAVRAGALDKKEEETKFDSTQQAIPIEAFSPEGGAGSSPSAAEPTDPQALIQPRGDRGTNTGGTGGQEAIDNANRASGADGYADAMNGAAAAAAAARAQADQSQFDADFDNAAANLATYRALNPEAEGRVEITSIPGENREIALQNRETNRNQVAASGGGSTTTSEAVGGGTGTFTGTRTDTGLNNMSAAEANAMRERQNSGQRLDAASFFSTPSAPAPTSAPVAAPSSAPSAPTAPVAATPTRSRGAPSGG